MRACDGQNVADPNKQSNLTNPTPHVSFPASDLLPGGRRGHPVGRRLRAVPGLDQPLRVQVRRLILYDGTRHRSHTPHDHNRTDHSLPDMCIYICITHHTHVYAHAHTQLPGLPQGGAGQGDRRGPGAVAALPRDGHRYIRSILHYISIHMYKCARFRLLGLCTHMRDRALVGTRTLHVHM